MTGLKIAPALHSTLADTPRSNTNGPFLLTDEQTTNRADRNTSTHRASESPRTRTHPWTGNYAHIQAQLMGGHTPGTFRRPTVSSPREAARAYTQTRRRPQTVKAMPVLKNSV